MTSEGFTLPLRIVEQLDLGSSPYTRDFCARVENRRQGFPEQKLFIDRLFSIGNIRSNGLYPPSTPDALRLLSETVNNSTMSRSQKAVFNYYLLKDYDLAHPRTALNCDANMEGHEDLADVTSRAEHFASMRCLARPWVVFAEAYWSLDNEDWEAAVNLLTDPIISDINFFPEILSVLSTHVAPPSRSLQLVQQLLLYTQRIPQSEKEIELQLVSLASTGSLDDAFAFVRSSGTSEAEQRRLREKLWTWTLGAPSFAVGAGQHSAQKDTIKQLIHLPFTTTELNHLFEFLRNSPRSIPAQNLSVFHDLVTLRLVHQGQYAESIELDRASSNSAGKDSDRQRRRDMVREFISILPEVQRRALAIEGDERAGRKEMDTDMVNGDTGMSTSERGLGESWVEVDIDMPSVSESMAVPVPLRTTSFTFNMAQNAPLPGSPAAAAAQTASPRPASPFTGPPRFASTHQSSPALSHRVMSGPFALPRNVSTGSPAPKPPKRLINDDDIAASDAGSVARRTTRRSFMPAARAPSEAPSAAETETDDHEGETSNGRNLRRSKRVVSGTQGGSSQYRQISPIPASPPSQPSRKTRQSSQPLPTPTMPGSFRDQQANPPQSVPEDEVLESESKDDVPPTPRQNGIGKGQPSTASRARGTRSVSRAALDEEEDGKQAGTQRKRTKTTRNAGEPVAEVAQTPPRTRRSTRASTRASTVQPSEQGSPTPSVASRRGTRASSVMSQTPRQTRSRKA